MDFFGRQQQARRSTRLLVLLFLLAVVAIIVTIYLAAVVALSIEAPRAGWWRPEVFAAVAAAVLLVVVLAAGYKTAQLRSGGAAVALLLGGQPIDPGTKDARERRLQNVVEELAIAAGVPVPAVFVLRDEEQINAFAAGWGTADAAIAVTSGCLDQLTRDELQGVVAHEFSHVFHGDMRLNIRLMGVLFGIVCIATIGEVIVRTVGRSGGGRGRGKGGAAGIVLIGIALLLIGSIGSFFAGLIRAAISRQREFLADASAVAYTRNPHGIGMALARIGGFGSRLASPHAREASHLLFADGIRRWFGNIGATHPPILQRIERVLPGFGRELGRGGAMVDAAQRTRPPALPAGMAPLAAAPSSRGPVRGDELPGLVGHLQPQFVDTARQLLDALPLELVAATREPWRARALLYALLLARDEHGLAARVLERLEQALAHETRLLLPHVRRLDHAMLLPMLELAMPALRQLEPPAIAALHADAQALARADAQLTPFEFVLLKTVRRHVPPPDQKPRLRLPRSLNLLAVRSEVELVLSVLARTAPDPEGAFTRGAAALHGLQPLALRPPAECRLLDLDPALDRLTRLAPQAMRILFTACARVADADGQIDVEEGELLRAFAAHWDCPLPPVWTPAALARV